MFIFVFILGLVAAIWFANWQAKKDRFPVAWHLLMGGVALAHVLIVSFRVMGLGSALAMIGVTMLWFFAWLVLLVVLGRQGKGKDVQFLLSYPFAYCVILFSSQAITSRQIEAAELAGDMIAVRVESYRDSNGELPKSLLKLSDFDGLPVPLTGVGLWGHHGFRYRRFKEGDYSLWFDAFMGIQHFRGDDGEWFAED